MAHRTAVLAALAALLVLLRVTPQASALGIEPKTPPAFGNFTEADYFGEFNPPSSGNSIIGNGAAGLAAAGFSQVVFANGVCQSFIPHFHPNAAELMLGVTGRMTIIYLVGNNLFVVALDPRETILIPPNTLHYYYNNDCSEAVIYSVLNSATPGIQIYYKLPGSVTSASATAATLNNMIKTQASNGTFDGSKAFFALTNNCQQLCSTPPPASPPPPPPLI